MPRLIRNAQCHTRYAVQPSLAGEAVPVTPLLFGKAAHFCLGKRPQCPFHEDDATLTAGPMTATNALDGDSGSVSGLQDGLTVMGFVPGVLR